MRKVIFVLGSVIVGVGVDENEEVFNVNSQGCVGNAGVGITTPVSEVVEEQDRDLAKITRLVNFEKRFAL